MANVGDIVSEAVCASYTCQYGGVSGSDVEVVDVEPGDGEAGAAHGEDQGDDGSHLCRVGKFMN